MGSQLEDEVESWKGFPWALRKEDGELWDEMIKEVRQYYSGAVERSGKQLTTDPFFMALILAQQRTIERLRDALSAVEDLQEPTAGPQYTDPPGRGRKGYKESRPSSTAETTRLLPQACQGKDPNCLQTRLGLPSPRSLSG